MNEQQINKAIEIHASVSGNWHEVEDIWYEEVAKFNNVRINWTTGTCGPGWWRPLLAALREVDIIMEKHPSFELTILQIKEKFGELRIYRQLQKKGHDYESAAFADDSGAELRDQIGTILDSVVETCRSLCEVCGEPGELRPLGWIKTLCDKHYSERIGHGLP
jgi:hypothetical protein